MVCDPGYETVTRENQSVRIWEWRFCRECLEIRGKRTHRVCLNCKVKRFFIKCKFSAAAF